MTKPHPMQQFHDLVQRILTDGVREPNRTGIDTLSLPGQVLTFDMADGFPAITTKKLAFKSAVGELVGFMRGARSAADFRALGCKVWDGNANETPTWLANPNRKGQDDLGRIYSAQWTDWRDWRTTTSAQEAAALLKAGYELIAADTADNNGIGVFVLRRGINQLEEVLKTLLTNPSDRRKVITGWRPDEWDQAALPSCHTEYIFKAEMGATRGVDGTPVTYKEGTRGRLHLSMQMRSYDVGLGFNPALSGLMLAIMAKLSGFEPGRIVMSINDAHIYLNHVPGLQELITREHYPQPTLHLGDSIPTLTDVSQVKGVFERIQPEDIQLVGYRHHPAIKMDMAV
jgi:thymidylate synthase